MDNAHTGQLTPEQRELLARRLRNRGPRVDAEAIPSCDRSATDLPLSYAQQRLWLLDRIEPGSAFYNIAGAVRLTGRLDEAALTAALRALVARHEVLRTRFVHHEDEARQRIEPELELDVPLLDLSVLETSVREAELTRYARAQAQQPFDLARGPLLRAQLVRLSGDQWVLLLIVHHIVADGWSVGVLVRELGALYRAQLQRAEAELPALPIQYADYAVWQRQWLEGARLEREVGYWREQLAGSSGVLELPTDHARPPVQRYRGAVHAFALNAPLTQSLERLALAQGATLFMVLLAAYAVVLSRYSGQRDLNVGTPIANRTRRELEGLVGFFVNTLVLRVRLEDDPSFETLLARVKQSSLDAYAHPHLPFEKLVEVLQPARDQSRTPLIQAEFILQNVPQAHLSLPEVEWETVALDTGTTKFAITLELEARDGGLRGLVRYDTDLFAPDTIERFARHYERVLQSIVARPQTPVLALGILPEQERRTIVVDFNTTARRFDTDARLHELIERQVAATPGAIAVRFRDEDLTYGALNARANRLARHLVRSGVRPDDVVALCVERSAEMMVGVLAILKAGAAYLPIDADHPVARLQSLLEEAQARVVLTQARFSERLAACGKLVIALDLTDPAIDNESADNPAVRLAAENLAYVIYTSGSTGRPKGAMLAHAGICNRLLWMQDEYRLDSRDVVLQKTPLTFDVSVWELFWPLVAGAQLVVAEPEGHKDSRYLVDLIRREHVTTIHFVPSMLQLFLEEPGVAHCTSLTRVVCSGEALPEKLARRFFAKLQAGLHNLYGPTEASVDVTYWACSPAQQGPVPIGLPIANTRMYVLDRNAAPVPIGVPGELHIGGVSLARGYLRSPALTAERFVPDPFAQANGARLYRTGDLARFRADGRIEYLGRLDHQVKVRGLRIELGEIEAALRAHAQVRDAVAMVKGEGPQRHLLGYFTPSPQALRDARNEAAQIAHWESIFQDAYSEGGAPPALNFAGWNDSYTGEPIPAADMQAWVDHSVAQVAAERPRRILELGCGTGLLLFRLAPRCERYEGWDISQASLDDVARNLHVLEGHAPRVRLRRAAADAVSDVAAGSYDCIVLNSVVQYFPDIDYLYRVLESAVRALSPGGTIFIGDVRHLALLTAFHASVQLHRCSPEVPGEVLRGRVAKQVDLDNELVIDPAFFAAIPSMIERVSAAQVFPKRGGAMNELTRFRYDVKLHVGGPEPLYAQRAIDWQQTHITVDEVRAALVTERADVLAVRGIDNARVAREVCALDLLHEGRGTTAGALRAHAAVARCDAEDPEAWAGLQSLPGYRVAIDWSASDSRARFDAIFVRRSRALDGRPAAAAPPRIRALDEYANAPLLTSVAAALVREVKEALKSLLPEYMVPDTLVCLRRLPLSPNGKVDRRALSAFAGPEPARGVERVAPEGEVEEQLAAIWSEVLGVHRVGALDDFFEIGGHSLLAMQAVSRIRERLGVELGLREMFTHPRLRALAARVQSLRAERGAADGPALAPVSRTQPLPLSYSQQRLWFLDRLEPGSAFYNIAGAVRLAGRLDRTALEAAIRALAARHEILRTRFVQHDGEAWQQIESESELGLDLPLVDLSVLDASRREAGLAREARAQAQQPFDLERGPLLRTRLVRLAEAQWVLLITVHHIVADGWSIGVLVRELGALYRAQVENTEPALAPLPIQYADYAVWQRQWLEGPRLERELGYWREQLAASTGVLELPTDYPRPPVQRYRGATHAFEIEAPLATALERFARAQGATLFMVLLAAFAVVLSRYSGQRDLNVGTPIANRERRELEGLIGFFVNTLVIRMRLEDDPSFETLVTRVKQSSVDAYAHPHLPFEKLVDALQPARDLSRSPLFQAMFVLDTQPRDSIYMPGVVAMRADAGLENATGTAKFDVLLGVAQSDRGLSAQIQYDTDLFAPDTIAAFARCYSAVLAGVIANPLCPVSAIDVLSHAERRRVLEDFGAAQQRFAAAPCVHEWFSRVAAARGDAIALTCGEEALSYAQLDAAANRLAHYLRARGVGPEARVGLCLERSVTAVVAVLAILKAGGAYVPLDPQYPAARLDYLVRDSGIALVLAHGETAQLAALHAPGVEVVDLLACATQLEAQPDEAPQVVSHPSQLAYVIYTSGSTGWPKGVCVTHANVVRLLEGTRRWFDFGPDDVWSCFHSFAFDFSVWEIWGALLHGGRLVVVPYWVSRSPEAFSRLMRSERVTVLNQTPSAFYQLLDHDAFSSDAPQWGLRHVIFGGEALEVERLRPWWARHGAQRVAFVNMYGITETTVHVTYERVRDLEDAARCIGRPIPDLSAYVLDRFQNPLPPGLAGELYIGGAGLARGYWNQAALTAQRFVPDPFGAQPGARLYRTGDRARWRADGRLDYLGRIDTQVKIRGFRIEPGEVEAELRRCPGVRDALVAAYQPAPEDHQLVAYVVPATDAGEPDVTAIHQWLCSRVPLHMVPNRIVALKAFPLTAHGKIDRKALPDPDTAAPARGRPASGPTTPTEARLVPLFEAVLKHDALDVDRSFFELGGHSIAATRLLAAIQNEFGVTIKLRDVFTSPSVAAMARVIDAQAKPASGVLVALAPQARYDVSHAQRRLLLTDQAYPLAYVQTYAVDMSGELDEEAFERAIQGVVDRHELLRTTFHVEHGALVQKVHPAMAFTLARREPGAGASAAALVDDLIANELATPFDLARGPLLRCTLVRVSPGVAVLIASVHHIAVDGESIAILVHEITALYNAGVTGTGAGLPAPDFQYKDYAQWHNRLVGSEQMSPAREFWAAQLRAAPPRAELAGDYERPQRPSMAGAIHHFRLDAHAPRQLQALSKQTAATPFMTALAVAFLLLHLKTRSRRLVIGTVTSGRHHSGTENIVGFMVNTLAIRVSLDRSWPFARLLSAVKDSVIAAFDHQDYPFDRVVEETLPHAGAGDRRPLFDMMLIGQTVEPRTTGEHAGLHRVRVTGRAQQVRRSLFDLKLEIVMQPDEVRGSLEYSTDLYSAASAERLAAEYCRLAALVLADPQVRIRDADLRVERDERLDAVGLNL